MPTIREAAEAHAKTVNDLEGKTFATIDPAEALNNRPCVLVAPPTIDYASDRGALVEWRLIALSSFPVGSLDALDELDDLLAAASQAFPTLERAAPGSYQLSPGADPVPCYVLTLHT